MKKRIFIPHTAMLLTVFSLCIPFSFGQTKETAIGNLKSNFEKYFIKTPVRMDNKEYKSDFSYDYILTDRYIAIKRTEASFAEAMWTTMYYKDISEFKSGEASFYFKKQTNLLIQSTSSFNFGTANLETFDITKAFHGNTTYAMAPFTFTSDLALLNSMNSDLEIIKKAIKAEDKIIEDKKMDSLQLIEDEKIKSFPFESYELFTSDSVKVNLMDYIKTNRKLKDKPTLMILYGYDWCGPCLSKMDSLINTGVGLKYNIVMVNIDGFVGFSKIKNKVIGRAVDYKKDALLLFDRTEQMKAIHNNAAPTYIWLDSKMNVKTARFDRRITLPKMETIFKKIE